MVSQIHILEPKFCPCVWLTDRFHLNWNSYNGWPRTVPEDVKIHLDKQQSKATFLKN